MDVGRRRKLCQKASPQCNRPPRAAGRRPAGWSASLPPCPSARPTCSPPSTASASAHPTVNHPPLFTVEQSQTLRGKISGGHTKNLFLRDKKGALFLVTTLEDAAIELKSLHRRLGASGRFSFGSADLLMETLGVVPGAVTPLAAINDTDGRVTVVLDAGLMEHEVINCHPLTNTMTTSLARADLVRFLEATGHPPRIVAGRRARDAGGLTGRIANRPLTPFNCRY